jgi:hypothetical protein
MQLFVSFMNSFSSQKNSLSSQKNSSSPQNNEEKPGNYVYWDYESEPGCWAHNDSLFMLMVIRKDNEEQTDNMDTDEGWEIVSSEDYKQESSCGEHVKTKEVRRNGLKFEYDYHWKEKFEWLLHYDFVRMLYDKGYFDCFLKKAEKGDSDAQTLVGCCYGHTGNMATGVVTHNIETALKWWHLAAEQGHKYAMREIALYHWHRGEEDEAKMWNDKGDLKIFILSRYSMDSPQFIDSDKPEEK